jgi:uncharacterized protein (DUF433 family)
LTLTLGGPYADLMAVHMTPELEKRLSDLVAKTGLPPEQLLKEALTDYDAGRVAALDWSQCPAVERVPGRVSGAWVLRGTRMPVATIFESLEAGANIGDILAWFDGLDREQVKAVIDFAGRSLDAPVRRR